MDPRVGEPGGGGATIIVWIAATVSRAHAGSGRAGEWRVNRTGVTSKPLTVAYRVSGDAVSGRDFAPPSGSVTISAGARSAAITLKAMASSLDQRAAIATLEPAAGRYYAGCPSQSLVVIRR